MHWSAILVLAMTGPQLSMDVAHEVSVTNSFTSYTDAWHAAHDAERPMLVILNPAEGEGITEDELRQDEKLQPLLDNYVVAVVDTGTDHGKKVHELFDSPALPRVVVIDKEQKKQIYRTSAKLSHDRLADVLDEHKEGTVKISQPVLRYTPPTSAYSNCPSCQRRWTF